AVRLLGRRLRLQGLRPLDEWADDVDLASLAQPLPDEPVGAGPLLLSDHPSVDRLAARGQLAQDRGVEVAVGRQRERAWDRRRRHVERVRCGLAGPLAVQRGALAHSEAVLLVDDAD